MVNKILDVSYEPLEDNCGSMLIYTLDERFDPHLFEDEYCTHVLLWWDTTASKYDASVKVYAFERIEQGENIITQVNSRKSPDVKAGMQYINERLA